MAEIMQRLDASMMGLRAARAWLEGVCKPVAPAHLPLHAAIGAIAAMDVSASSPLPAADTALRDGYAVASADLVGANSFSPALLTQAPRFVCVGDPLPAECDAVIDAGLVGARGLSFEIAASITAGEGVRRQGEDMADGVKILSAGARIDAVSVMALQMAGFATVTARRPRVGVVVTASEDGPATTGDLIAAFVAEAGASVDVQQIDGHEAAAIAHACGGVVVDLLLVVGGTGTGPQDEAIAALRKAGRVAAHGLALDPGRTAAIGMIGDTPFIALPGRFDAAMGVWLALVTPALRLLSGALAVNSAPEGVLTRKISSNVGVAQIVLLESLDAEWTPIATGDIPLAQMLRAVAWLMIDETSEGLPPGARVTPTYLPNHSPLPGHSSSRPKALS